jgi:hypothetical protein
MGDQKNQLWNLELTIVSCHNANIIPEMFEPSKNPNPTIIEDVCASDPKKWKNLQ